MRLTSSPPFSIDYLMAFDLENPFPYSHPQDPVTRRGDIEEKRLQIKSRGVHRREYGRSTELELGLFADVASSVSRRAERTESENVMYDDSKYFVTQQPWRHVQQRAPSWSTLKTSRRGAILFVPTVCSFHALFAGNVNNKIVG